jgi:8-oxo-dGTP pyrophosphatase MutT (NUDIX family)
MSDKLWPVSVKGVVFNKRGEVLLLKNPREEWELLGGRLEPGESPQECLMREIQKAKTK